MKISLEYINNFQNGIENAFTVIPNKFKKTRQIKLCIYYLLLFLFLPYKKIIANSVFFINGKSQRRMKFGYSHIADENIYHGFCYRSIREIRKLNTIVTPIKRSERLQLVVYVFRTYKIVKPLGFTLWLEYNVFAFGLRNIGMSTVYSRGHYDEITTWISGFANLYGFNFDIYQHGVVMNNLCIPHKIKCNHFWAFDKYSIKVFTSNFFDISHKAVVYNFTSSVDFEVLKREKGKIYIGIIDQCNKEWIDMIIESVRKSLNNCIFVVMLHPLSKHKFLRKDKGILIERDKKFLNLDYVLTESSTLIIDYYRDTGSIPVFFTSNSMKECFSEYPFQYIELEKVGETIERMERNKIYEKSIYCC